MHYVILDVLLSDGIAHWPFSETGRFVGNRSGQAEADTDATLLNVNSRLEAMRSMYKSRSGRFLVSFLTPSEYSNSKHLLRNTADEDRIITASQNGVSRFYKNHTSARLQRAFIQWVMTVFATPYPVQDAEELDAILANNDSPRGSLWQYLMTAHNIRVFVNNIDPVGASGGANTSYFCFDITFDGGNGVGHAYPVTQAEAERGSRGVELPAVEVL